MKATHKLEHAIFNSWKKSISIKNLGSNDEPLIVGVSGGLDSMVLLRALPICFPDKKIIVAHCHHGSGTTQRYRDQAARLVKATCAESNLEFEMIRSESVLKSEAEFRNFRLAAFSSLCKKHNSSIVVLAHHRDDWLENQLIKLIRGTSFGGLNKNFQWSWLKDKKYYIWRPLSHCGRGELAAYRELKNVPFLADPSNLDTAYLRNWIRNSWLPLLETRRPGSTQRLALSLINSIQEIKPSSVDFPWDFKSHSIDFVYFQSLSSDDKLRCLAFYVSTQGLKSIKSSQLKEIIRQLDNTSNHYHIHFKTFDCLVNAGQLIIRIL